MMITNKVGIAVTVRAHEDIIIQFIDYHLSKGIDEIYIFFDDPCFNKNIFKFGNDKRIFFISCDEYYWNKLNNYRFDQTSLVEKPLGIEQRQFSNYEYARRITSCDWMANIDIDELIYSPYEIKKILDILPINYFSIRMVSKEAVYTTHIEENDIFDTCFFKLNNKLNEKSSAKFYPRFLFSNGGFWGHKLGKILARTTESLRHIGNHYIFPLNDDLIVDVEFKFLFLLHFEGLSEKYFIEKQIRRINNDVVVQRISKNERARLNYFSEQYKVGGEEKLKDLYRLMHVFESERFDDAVKLGFIEKIDFKKEYKKFDLYLEDFHFSILNYSTDLNKVISDKSQKTNVFLLQIIVQQEQKGVLFFITYNGAYIGLASDGVNLKANDSVFTKVFDIVLFNEFLAIKNKDNYLISKKNGVVKFNSKNLGNWELFEIKN